MRQIALIVALLTVCVTTAPALDRELVDEAEAALVQATQYLTENAAIHGGYAGSYLADLSDQWGEGHITDTMNWVQPPGSPSTGFAFLAAWRATGNEVFLDAAVENAYSLAWGQLECGGWYYNIDFSERGEERYFYRHNADSENEAFASGHNTGTMDDNVTQHATRLLMHVDQALDFADETIHDAAMAALDYLLEAQAEGGGWPQRYPLSGRSYGDFMTFNDNTIRDCCRTMMDAWEIYGDRRYHDSLVAAGAFIIRAQLPEPQATWGQQYDADLKPAWARRFEPPAAITGESVGVMRLLISIAEFTGDEKYLEPLPAALDWFERSRLPDGDWARFYELKTNRPLYFTKDTYRLTYDDSNLPTHYGFKGGYNPDSVRETHEQIMAQGLDAWRAARQRELTEEERIERAEAMEDEVREVLASRSENGVWLDTGGYGPDVPHLNMQTVQRRMATLSTYIRYATGGMEKADG